MLLRAITSVFLLCVGLKSVQSEDVWVKIDKNVKEPPSCGTALDRLKAFLVESSSSILEATHQLHQFSNIVVEIPDSWGICATSGVQAQRGVAIQTGRVPLAQANILIQDDPTTRAIQPEGCGIRGKHVQLKQLVMTGTIQNRDRREFVAEWIKYRFGVFDEHGYSGDGTFPMFYQRSDQVYPNSCANGQIKGTFNESCLAREEGLCVPESNQNGITSSLLYSSDPEYFPMMAKVCDESNHDQDAPNLQNLLCDYKSALEVIQSQNGRRQLQPVYPTFTVVQPKTRNGIGELYIIQDYGTSMGQYWPSVRMGLEQLFTSLNHDTKVTVLYNNHFLNERTFVYSASNPRYWGDRIFPDELGQNSNSLSLKASFKKLTERLDMTLSPTVLVITASDNANEDLSEAIALVTQNDLPVSVVSMPGIQDKRFLELAQHGQVLTLAGVPGVANSMVRGKMAGSLFQACVEHMEGINYQRVFESEHPPLQFNWVNGSMDLKEDMTSLVAPRFQIMILSPWNTYPEIHIKAPDGTTWDSGVVSNTIIRQWSFHVLYVPSDSISFQPGQWNYAIKGPNSQQPWGDKIFVVAYVDVGSRGFARSFVERKAHSGFNATDSTFALSVFGSVDNQLDPAKNWTMQARVVHPDGQDQSSLILNDDGLKVPDVAQRDLVFSQYLFQIKQAGYYSTEFELVNEGGTQRYWPGPSFFVSKPINGSLTGDRIPPSRIMDLRAQGVEGAEGRIALVWTAPGDDLNLGQADYYRIFCGLSRDDLSFDDCVAVRGLVRFAHEAGTREEIQFQLAILGVNVYFGIKAYDNVGNSGDMSNVAQIFVPGQTTITTPSDLNPDGPENGIYISEGGFIALLVILSLILLLVLIITCVYVVMRMRKRRQEKKAEKLILEELRARNRQPAAIVGNHYSDVIWDGEIKQKSKLPQNQGNRTRTKTNGSLHPRLNWAVERDIVADEFVSDSASSSSSSENALVEGPVRDEGPRINQGYIGSPQIEIRSRPKSAGSSQKRRKSRHPRREGSISRLNRDQIQLDPHKLEQVGPRDRRPIIQPEHFRDLSGDTMSTNTFQPIEASQWKPEPPIRRHASQRDYVRQFQNPSDVQRATTSLRGGGHSGGTVHVQPGQPFNYIAFSEMLYGDHNKREASSPESPRRAVSYV